MLPLAFVDVETTGLSPSENRIAEVGVVTVDGARARPWTALLAPSSSREVDSSGTGAGCRLPAFREIAPGLAQRLEGRLLVAHNARFDFAFLKAEFERVGISFTPQVLCTVALSRRLHPHLPHHDLDSLAERHGLAVATRHRALPDADLLWQWWQLIQSRCAPGVLAGAIDALLAGPVLPAALDPQLIERLPDAPGAFVFLAENGAPLLAGSAGNLRRHVENYFRVDRASTKALEFAHRIGSIRWRATRGMLGARLHATLLQSDLVAPGRSAGASAFTWQLAPDACPGITIARMCADRDTGVADTFGIFATERRARNALVRLARTNRLCFCVLGIGAVADVRCGACPTDRSECRCADPIERRRQLLRLLPALRPMRIPAWPFSGPIGIRERGEIHVVDRWRFLGTARDQGELHGLLERCASEFDVRHFRILRRMLARLPGAGIVDLGSIVAGSARSAEATPAMGARLQSDVHCHGVDDT